jgi:hypothetical protein
MTHAIARCLAFFALLFVSVGALAQTASNSFLSGFEGAEIIALDEATVKRFIDVGEALNAQQVDYADQLDEPPSIRSWAQAAEDNDKINRIIRQNGFKDGEDFALTSYAVMLAMGAVELDANRAEMEQARAQLKAMKDQLPPETYTMMEQQLLGAFAIFDNVPAGNLALVRKYREALSAIGG